MCTGRVGLHCKRFIHAVNSIKLFGFILCLREIKIFGRLKTRLEAIQQRLVRGKSSRGRGSFAGFSMRGGLFNESTKNVYQVHS